MDPSLRSRKNGIAASQAYSPPAYYYPELEAQRPRPSNSLLRTASLTALCLAAPALLYTSAFSSSFPFPRPPTPSHVQDGLRSCRDNAHQPGPPADFGDRTTSDRSVPGTKAVLIRNATIWTGEDMGNEVLESSDLLLDGGIIKAVGSVGKDALKGLDYDILDAFGAWVTPGIVDMHSHAGVEGAPGLGGTSDGNSLKSNTNPYLRSLDGINTHDLGFRLIISGGVTTTLILPGSADSIGGQAFVFKLRPTEDNSVSSLVLEAPFDVHGNRTNHFRHMKHAFGENPSRVWGQTRMDSLWDLRNIYEQARLVKVSQDDWCVKANDGDTSLGKYPESPLRLEALVDVLRGKVLVNAHSYTTTDFDALVRLTQEFKFHVSAIHHAHEAHLVPDLLKKMWGGPPGAAIFAAFSRYKSEAYRHSTQAPKILADAGIQVAMKSDHPGINSRYVLHEAVQAHHYGLEANLALSSVTTVPATLIGKAHRVGYLRKGHDADIAIWQSHPLTLGATPSQVFIDGIPQLANPAIVSRPAEDQVVPASADYATERKEVIASKGESDLNPNSRVGKAVFVNVSSVIVRRGGKLKELLGAMSSKVASEETYVVVEDGRIDHVGENLATLDASFAGAPVIDLKGGSIGPGLTSFGAGIGLGEIDFEPSTGDMGEDAGPGAGKLPTGVLTQAADGLAFGGKEMLVDLRAGVTKSISYPISSSDLVKGYTTFISLAAPHRLAAGAILSRRAGLAVHIGHGEGGAAISTQIALVRSLLERKPEKGTPVEEAFGEIVKGEQAVIFTVHSADQIASLLELKAESEKLHGKEQRWVFNGAAEAYLLANEIAAANVGVILAPVRGFPESWDQVRVLPGAPLSKETGLSVLHQAGVNVAIGTNPFMHFMAGQTRWEVAMAKTDSVDAPYSTLDLLSFATVALEKMLGLEGPADSTDWVAVEHGSILEAGQARVVAVGAGKEVLLYK